MNHIYPSYRILVLYNSESSDSSVLSDAVAIAKKINGAIDLLSVYPYKAESTYSNQLTLMRSIKSSKERLKSEINTIIDTIEDEENLPIINSSRVGEVTHVVLEHIKRTAPDIVVLGKKKTRTFAPIQNSIFDLVLNNHNGITLVSGGKKSLFEQLHWSLGFVDRVIDNNSIAKVLIKNSVVPTALFQLTPQCNERINKKVLLYDFQENTNSSLNISQYITKNKVSLLCVDRDSLLKRQDKHKYKRILNNTLINTETPLMVFPNK